MNDDRGELRRVERNVVRVVVLDAANHVLLLQTRDLGNPAFGTSWVLPGGGMEPGEPTLLRLFLAGDEIAEPLERWP
jgi:8-oxo-dGTP pyrophosphatase MutT (NUDIX family)